MNLKLSTLLWTFIWCIFMGITAGSIGLGALLPAMNFVAKPFVCPAGQMQMESQVYNPYPGETVTQETWYCVDAATGAKAELGLFPMSLYSGTIYGLLFFLIVLLGMVLMANRRRPTQSTVTSDYSPRAEHQRLMGELAQGRQGSASRPAFEQQSAHLLTLLESNQITKEEYLKRVAELAKDS